MRETAHTCLSELKLKQHIHSEKSIKYFYGKKRMNSIFEGSEKNPENLSDPERTPCAAKADANPPTFIRSATTQPGYSQRQGSCLGEAKKKN
jgi:hypothetical protein